MTNNKPPDQAEAELRVLWLTAQAGDELAYRQALSLMAIRLRLYFRRRMPNLLDEVEDLVQETLLAIHLHRGTYDPEFPVSAWLMGIARHKLVDLFRRRGRRENRHDAYDDSEEHEPMIDESTALHAVRDMTVLLQALPATQQRAIQLTKVDGFSVAEAAQQTGASEASIKVMVHRGLKRLAELVKRSHQ